MAIDIASILRSTTTLAAPRILVHGVAGVGKTTFAAGAPAPVFICTEDGLGTLEATHFPLARTFDAVMEALAALYAQDHTFATVVVDSVDWHLSPWDEDRIRAIWLEAGGEGEPPR